MRNIVSPLICRCRTWHERLQSFYHNLPAVTETYS